MFVADEENTIVAVCHGTPPTRYVRSKSQGLPVYLLTLAVALIALPLPMSMALALFRVRSSLS